MTKQYILFIFSLTKEKSNIDYSLTVKTEKHSKKYKFTAHTHTEIDLKSQTSIVIVKLRTNPRKDKNQSEIKQSNYSSRK